VRAPLLFAWLFLLGASCLQKLDPNAASGLQVRGGEATGGMGPAVDRSGMNTGGTAAGRGGNGGNGGSDPQIPDASRDGAPVGGMITAPPPIVDAAPGPSADPCIATRNQARTIVERNCAPCHQAPAKQGNFDFCLNVATLTSAVSSTGRRFVVPGAPEESRLYQRALAGEMPPPGRMPRPSQDDVGALRAWIATCIVPGAPGNDWHVDDDKDAAPPSLPSVDAGSAGCGQPGGACCVANSCAAGGCCVLGRCRGQGQACSGGNGENGDDGVPGICTDGSCSNEGVACGKVAQPCCGAKATCTAPRSECMAGVTCQACGNTGQPCCGNGGNATCIKGLDCQGAGFGRVGICQPCGALDQLCCGNGTAAQQTCNPQLTCRFVAGMGARCGAAVPGS
jgi:hypothetical protein